jgi:nitrite reductase/ring-hydroxylating ferredoxin subunit
MSLGDRVRGRWPKDWPIGILPRDSWTRQRPTYRDARPAIINAALDRSRRRPTGNWYAFAASRAVRPGRPLGARVAGIDLVAWRDKHRRLRVGPGGCPHLGADLATGVVHDGVLYCRWHGLALDGETCEMRWKPLPSHDDGVLAWVRLDATGGEPPLDAPVIPSRPAGDALTAVTRMVGACEPCDVIANRLDPWHGAWLHPYSFTALRVLSATPTDCPPAEDRFLVEVTFTVGQRYGVPVHAEFTCPDPRTVTMEIVDGEGAGSVVETHATPLRPGPDGLPRTAVIEAVVAHSDRPGFRHVRHVAAAVRPLVVTAARRLWRDDIAYAERRYALRSAR